MCDPNDLRRLLDRSNLHVACIVDYHINAAIQAHSFGCNGVKIILHGRHVELQYLGAFTFQALEGCEVAAGGDDFLSPFEEGASEVIANPGAAAFRLR